MCWLSKTLYKISEHPLSCHTSRTANHVRMLWKWAFDFNNIYTCWFFKWASATVQTEVKNSLHNQKYKFLIYKIKKLLLYLWKKVMLFYNLIQHLMCFNSRSNITLQHLKLNNKSNTDSPSIGITLKVKNTHDVFMQSYRAVTTYCYY